MTQSEKLSRVCNCAVNCKKCEYYSESKIYNFLKIGKIQVITSMHCSAYHASKRTKEIVRKVEGL